MAMSADRQYRVFVVPLAGFLIIAGLAGALVFALPFVPITAPIPLIQSSFLNRAIFVLLSVLTVIFGIGFYVKSRTLWRGFFVYLALGTLLSCVGMMLDPRYDGAGRWLVVLVGALINTVVGAGVYLGTVPVFRRGRR